MRSLVRILRLCRNAPIHQRPHQHHFTRRAETGNGPACRFLATNTCKEQAGPRSAPIRLLCAWTR